jgi:hypothetical protein
MSFSDYVDWAAHFGGSIQGFLLAAAFLSKELDNVYSKVRYRFTTCRFCFFSLAIFVIAVVYANCGVWRVHISIRVVIVLYDLYIEAI